MIDLSTVLIALAICAGILIIATARGLIFQGTKLDRFLDGITGTVSEYVDDAVDSARDEIAELRNAIENIQDSVFEMETRPNAPTADAASLQHLNEQIADIRKTLIEEKAIRDRQTESLGNHVQALADQQQAITASLANKPDMEVVNALAKGSLTAEPATDAETVQ